MVNIRPGFASAKKKFIVSMRIFTYSCIKFVFPAKENLNLLLSVLQLTLLMAFPSYAWPQDDGCVKSGCHDKIGVKEWVHGPVGANICTVCHVSVTGKDHEFIYPQEGENLCFMCHEDKRVVSASSERR